MHLYLSLEFIYMIGGANDLDLFIVVEIFHK
jgi:hypothetical protein